MGTQKLTGKVAVVTGASRGIGRAASLALARQGAAVVVNYCAAADAELEKSHAARDVVEAIEDAGGRAVAHEDRGPQDEQTNSREPARAAMAAV